MKSDIKGETIQSVMEDFNTVPKVPAFESFDLFHLISWHLKILQQMQEVQFRNTEF